MAAPLQQKTSWATSSAPSSRAQQRRWLVLWLLFAITIINFIDRQTVSVLAPLIRASLHRSWQPPVNGQPSMVSPVV